MYTLITSIVIITSILVYIDASNHNIGKIPNVHGFWNMSAMGWFLSCLGLWIIAFPAYLFKRSELLAKAFEQPKQPGKIANFIALCLSAAGVIYIAISVIVLFFSQSVNDTTTENVSVPRATTVVQPTKITAEDMYAAKVRAAQSLHDVLPLIRPAMTDHQGNEISVSAAGLAMWMLNQPSNKLWAELNAMQDFSRKDVVKDISLYRGEKLCNRGSIIQILTDRSAGKPVYYGVLDVGVLNLNRFVAVGSSAGIVEGSAARFCGIIIGTHNYSNSLGGMIDAVEVVGLFDIPQNSRDDE